MFISKGSSLVRAESCNLTLVRKVVYHEEHMFTCLSTYKKSIRIIIISILFSILPGLPDEKGRLQILHIHTARMRGHQLLSADVDIKELAVETKNFSGAELEGLVRAAQSTAMNRHIKVRKIS